MYCILKCYSDIIIPASVSFQMNALHSDALTDTTHIHTALELSRGCHIKIVLMLDKRLLRWKSLNINTITLTLAI